MVLRSVDQESDPAREWFPCDQVKIGHGVARVGCRD